MVSFPNAKINLGLNILSKRADGYHNIDSCFYPIPWNDSLEILPSESFLFHSYGLPIPGDQSGNLCVKAYELLEKKYQIPPVAIHLLKNIPMGAGLGGGSADGGFTLKLLNEIFELDLSNNELEVFALELGSDCPFFINNKAAIAQGRGEKLSEVEVDLSGYYLAIHNPGIHISTKEAYGGITPNDARAAIQEIVSAPIETWKDALRNDFESSVFEIHPEIKELKEEMYEAGAIYASMTGSGSTVYGIFDSNMGLPPEWKSFKLN